MRVTEVLAPPPIQKEEPSEREYDITMHELVEYREYTGKEYEQKEELDDNEYDIIVHAVLEEMRE